jgi:hypothetical protein
MRAKNSFAQIKIKKKAEQANLTSLDLLQPSLVIWMEVIWMDFCTNIFVQKFLDFLKFQKYLYKNFWIF